MKKFILPVLLCLALTACTTAPTAQLAIANDPIVPTANPAPQTIDDTDTPAVPFVVAELYYDLEQNAFYEQGAVPPESAALLTPGDAELSYQQAADLADAFRAALDWPAPAADAPWQLFYTQDADGHGAFTASYRYAAGGTNYYSFRLDSVTGAVLCASAQDYSLDALPFADFAQPTFSVEDYAAAAETYNTMLTAADPDTAAAKAAAALAALGYPDSTVDPTPLQPLLALPATLEEAWQQYGTGGYLPMTCRFWFRAALADGREVAVGYSFSQEYLTDFAIALEEPTS